MNTAPTPFFSTPARITALLAAADAWLGTPYVTSGAVRGNGASCHMLAAAVLRDAGLSLPVVPERGATRRCEYLAAMRDWLEGHPEMFAPVPGPLLPGSLSPGDCLLCKIGIGHIALYLGGQGASVLQVLYHTPAHCVSFNDPNVAERILAAYRPLVPSECRSPLAGDSGPAIPQSAIPTPQSSHG